MQHIANSDASLLDILAKLAPQSSKTTLRSWIKEGRVAINGRKAKRGDEIVASGQKVTVGAKVQFLEDNLRILYEDEHLVAIDKPEGMLSVATAFEKGKTAHALLKDWYRPRKVFVVHRLDQETSGVMLFALSEEAYQGLKDIFESHEIERSYCAIVQGKVSPPSGIWQSYLYEDANYVVHSTDDPEKGRLAITHYRVLNSSPRYTRLELKLETGRKNQIRVHCSDHSHPVVGDSKYGATANPLKRLCLHAQLIAFIHPVTGKKMHFSSPLPETFDRLIKEKGSHA
jgi:23S rRNA pseudouridine1911/1915/1917 synthase